MHARHRLVPLFALAAACSGGGTDPDEPDGAPPGPPDADTSGYTELIGHDWTLPAGTESFQCVRVTAATDLWVHGLRPIAPLGTHHTVLAITDPNGPDGASTCDNTFAIGSAVLYASGVGTEALELPPGVAVRVPAGQQLLLNLHLFNAGSEDLSGHSGIAVVTLAAAEVTAEAGVVLAGKVIGLNIPPGPSTQSGRCTIPSATELYAIMPHMHTLGTHIKVTFDGASGSRVLLDEPYEFGDQRYRMLLPTQAVAADDRVLIDCTYDNTTPNTVGFGESTNDEMCFAITYTIPRITATAGSAFCIN
jgi:hypothetical protein